MSIITWQFPPAANDGPSNRDLALDTNGDLLVMNGDLQMVKTGQSGAAQGVQIRTNFVQGEWFADINLGIPYWTRVFVKNPSLVEVKYWYQLAILDAPDIAFIQQMNLVYNGNRSVKVTFTGKSTNGQSLTGVGSTS